MTTISSRPIRWGLWIALIVSHVLLEAASPQLKDATLVDEHIRVLSRGDVQKSSIVLFEGLGEFLLIQVLQGSETENERITRAEWCAADFLRPFLSKSLGNEIFEPFLNEAGLDYRWLNTSTSFTTRLQIELDPSSARSAADALDVLAMRPDLFPVPDYDWVFLFSGTIPFPQLSPFFRYASIVDGCRQTWMGPVKDLQMPFVESGELGWVYIMQFDDPWRGHNIVFYDYTTSLVYATSQRSWPYVYRYSDGHWLYYSRGSRSDGYPGWAYDTALKDWIQW